MVSAKDSQTHSAGPHVFTEAITIARPAGDVYPLLDLADPRHAKRQLGDRLDAVPGQPQQFTLVVSELPDAVFTLSVTHAVQDREFAFTCEAAPPMGRLMQSHEHYALEPLDSGSCRLVLTQTVTFDGPLGEDAFGFEALMLTLASRSALGKIKLHAEEGVAAVRSLMEERQARFAALDCDTE